jgi:hypothetical protein
MDLDKILKEYQATKANPFGASKVLNSFTHGTKGFKGRLLKLIETKLLQHDPQDLGFYLSLAYWDGLDQDYKPVLKELILATWHDNHEDLVGYIEELGDDSFTEDIYTIATTPQPYRQYDDELEATLRKCVHALKAINSKGANEKLELLRATGNPNVLGTLKMYQ